MPRCASSRPWRTSACPSRSRSSTARSAARWSTPRDVLRDPAGDAARALCAALGVPFDRGDAVLAGRAAARPTASGRSTGTPRVEASTGFAPVRRRATSRCPTTARAAARRCRPYYDDAGRAPAARPERRLPCCSSSTSATATCVVNVDGRLAHRDEAAVSPFDSAVQGGDAVWEGLRLYDGRIFRLDEHLARLRRSAHALAFAAIPSDEEITERDPPHAGRQRHARRRAHPADADPRREGHQRDGPAAEPVRADADRARRAQAAGLRRRAASRWSRPACAARPPDSLDPKIHHNNLLTSILAKIEANVAGADDALMLDHRGVRRGDQRHERVPRRRTASVRTPTTRACPEGITRATVLELCRSSGRRRARSATCR